MKNQLERASGEMTARAANQAAADKVSENGRRKAARRKQQAEVNRKFKTVMKQWLLYAVAITTVIYALYRAWGQS